MANGSYPGITAPPIYGSGGKQTAPKMLPRVTAPPVLPQTAGGVGEHGALHGNAGRVAAMPGGMTPTQVHAMQQFLNNHGFQVAQDGVFGPQTKSAAAAFRANHKSGNAWSTANGVGVHPATKVAANPHGNAGDTGAGAGAGVSTGAAGAGSSDALQQLLQSLLSGGGNVGSGYDAQSFGDAAAAPDDAAAAALQRQVSANPQQENQNQADISSWYGLDPKADGYKLSVLGRLAQARGLDAGAATAAEGNMGDLAKSLAGSIGGSANDGSSSVLAAGANAAGTMGALGEAQKQYADQMDPLLRAEAVGAASKEKASNSQALQALQDSLASAKGQATADRATGVMGATDKNNSLAQQRFANQGNLLSTLAQMQAADPNANTLANAKTRAQIAEINAQASHARAAAQHLVNGGSSSTATADRVDPTSAAISVTKGLGLATDPASGAPIVPPGMHSVIATHIGAYLRGLKLAPSDPNFKKIGDAIFSMFVDTQGRPLQAPPNWGI